MESRKAYWLAGFLGIELFFLGCLVWALVPK